MRLYSDLRLLLSHKNKGRLSQVLYSTGLKPKINSKAKSPFKKGVIVFSADFEMAWAFRNSKTMAEKAIEAGLIERRNLPILLSLFDEYNIPVTWATVGHLFLNGCDRSSGGIAHAGMPRPNKFENRNWKFDSGDWYQHDPCTDYLTDPAWYAPDLIELILNSKTKHEIGCHTFSHIDCSNLNCDKLLMNEELEMCKKLALEKSIELVSFVFPGGTFGNFESLKENGFICYRKPLKNHIDIPHIDLHGLVVIPSSYGLDIDPYGWSIDFHKKIVKRFIEKTIKYKQVCHFWFHPSINPWYINNILPFVLESVALERANGNIEVLTMDKLAKKVLAND